MEIILRFSRPKEDQKETIPEAIAAQWLPGLFYIILWKRVALIFYRAIDCQGIVGAWMIGATATVAIANSLTVGTFWFTWSAGLTNRYNLPINDL